MQVDPQVLASDWPDASTLKYLTMVCQGAQTPDISLSPDKLAPGLYHFEAGPTSATPGHVEATEGREIQKKIVKFRREVMKIMKIYRKSN